MVAKKTGKAAKRKTARTKRSAPKTRKSPTKRKGKRPGSKVRLRVTHKGMHDLDAGSGARSVTTSALSDYAEKVGAPTLVVTDPEGSTTTETLPDAGTDEVVKGERTFSETQDDDSSANDDGVYPDEEGA